VTIMMKIDKHVTRNTSISRNSSAW